MASSQEEALQKRIRELENALKQARQQLDQQVQEAGILRQFERELARQDSLEGLVDCALEWVGERVAVAHGLIVRWLPERHLFEVIDGFGKPLGMYIEPKLHIEIPADLMPPAEREGMSAEITWNANGTILSADLRRPDGNLLGLMVFQYDQTGRNLNAGEHLVRQCADRLETAMHHTIVREQFRDLSHYRAQLFRLLSHDLRQPLTVLMGFIQLAQLAISQGRMDVIAGYLDNIDKGARDLSKLLEEVLLKEQVDTASREDWTAVSMREIGEQAVDKHRQIATWKSQQIEVSLTDDPAMCQGVSLQLKEAASNLISNAVKYTPEGGHIKIALWVYGKRIYFEVSDNGYGISKARQARLFEPFYRAQEAGTENIKGTGLGLNLVKGIIENHEGDVYFSSESGKGSTFGFWLPAVTTENTSPEAEN